MKNKIFALSLLTAAGMASCSDSSIDADVVSPEQGELTTYYLNSTVIFPQELANTLTRADGDDDGSANPAGPADQKPDDGDQKEYYVDDSKVFFALYNDNGVALTPATMTNSLDWEMDSDPELTKLKSQIVLQSAQKPKYLVVYVNLDKEKTSFLGQSLDELLGAKGTPNFLPGYDYLPASWGSAEDRETFYQRPASFRNMMLERYANLTEGEFFMMNSSFNSDWMNDDEGHHNVRAVNVSNMVFTEEEYKNMTDADKKSNEVLVYLERVVAKVNTLFNITNTDLDKGGVMAATTTDGLPIVQIKQKTGYNNGTYDAGTKSYAPATYFVKFDGWQLNATNKSFVPLKDIGETPFHIARIAGNDYQPFRTGRSYWAFDRNYDYNTTDYVNNQEFDHNKGWSYGSKRPQLNYYTLTNMKRLKFGDYTEGGGNSTDIADYTDYCFENTMSGSGTTHTDAVTHVLVRAQYVKDAAGAKIPVTENIYRVAKTIYEEEGLKNYILDHITAMFPLKGVVYDDIELIHNNQDFYNHNDVKSRVVVKGGKLDNVEYTGSDGNVAHVPTADITDPDPKANGAILKYQGDVTELVFGEATVYTFERGVCYYSIPIKHFASNHTVGEEGYYGVVRNHWYKVVINNVDAFGHPATPGDAPGDKSDPSYDPDKPYDPQNPGGTNPGGGNPGTDDKNPVDPDNPRNPDPTNPDPSNPHPGNPGKPIIPEDSTDEDHNLSVQIKVLPWAKMKMEAQLGGMQEWHK